MIPALGKLEGGGSDVGCQPFLNSELEDSLGRVPVSKPYTKGGIKLKVSPEHTVCLKLGSGKTDGIS